MLMVEIRRDFMSMISLKLLMLTNAEKAALLKMGFLWTCNDLILLYNYYYILMKSWMCMFCKNNQIWLVQN